jgi:hypothetical protein
MSLRSKPLTIRNLYHEYSQTHRSGNDNERSPSPEYPNKLGLSESPDKANAEVMEHTCSSFMRNYIDKLKKQRKREKKKLDSGSHSKQNEGSFGCDLASLPSIPAIPQGKSKVLVLKKI